MAYDEVDFPSVCLKESHVVEMITSVKLNLYSLCYDKEGWLIGEPSRGSAGRFKKRISESTSSTLS